MPDSGTPNWTRGGRSDAAPILSEDTDDRANSAFLARVSHAVRTPLTVILGFSDLLLEHPALETTLSERRNALRGIQRNANSLLHLLDDLLGLSQIELGVIKLGVSSCAIQAVLEDIRLKMRTKAETKGLSLTFEYRGSVPKTIVTDRPRLEQILSNLIENAIKYTEVGGVRVIMSSVRCENNAPMIQFEVVDTGIGIPPARVDRLFAAFRQTEESITQRQGRMELGLAISRRLARLLGGDITVDSTPGVGSTFRLTIAPGPIDNADMIEQGRMAWTTGPGPGPGSIRPPAPALQNCRVLVAEDCPNNRRLIRVILEKAGADVTGAQNGQVAVDKAIAARDRGETFDVILMDMRMPVLDGYGATRSLRQAGYDGPIIAVTAQSLPGERERCLASGCDDYHSKPIVPEELFLAIHTHLRRTESISQDYGRGSQPVV